MQDSSIGFRPPKSSILALEKSTEPFSEQIGIACQYLHIDLEQEYGSKVADRDTLFQNLPSRSNPRVDFALRWLLKRMSHREALSSSSERPRPDQHGSRGRHPCLDAHAWTLLKALVIRTLPTNVARLLKEHKLFDSLEYTLCFLAENHLYPRGALNTGIVQEEDAELSTSSDESVDSSGRRHRKRKRGQEDPTEDILACHLLYVRVCDFLETLLHLTTDPLQDSQIYIVEHLKASLRAPPEQAASVLGYALRYVNARPKTSNGEHTQSTFVAPSSFLPFTKLWQLAIEDSEGPRSTETHLSFSKFCLIPTLDWLEIHSVPDVAPESLQQSLVKSFEANMVANVILPARGAYLNANRPEKARDPDVPTTKSADLLAPLRVDSSELKAIEAGGALPLALRKTAWRSALVFRLATDNPPRNTPKQKAAESAWLQKLLRMLIEMTTTYDMKPFGNVDSSKYECHHPILQVALQTGIRVDTLLLEDLLLRHSGLFAQGHSVDWSLINVCIELDPRLWLVLNVLPPTQLENNSVHHNDLISALLYKLSIYGSKNRSGTSSTSDVLLHKIIFPLIDVFVKGRQLTRFLELWCERISVKLLESRSLDQTSIWEDEALIQYISKNVESSLTYSQIISLLHDYSGNTTASGDLIPGYYDHSPYFLVLDSILSAGFTERAIEELRPTVAQLYQQLLVEINVQDNPRRLEKKWKLIMLINERWCDLQEVSEIERMVLEHAIKFSECEIDGAVFQTRLQAFRCMIQIARRTFPVPRDEMQDLQSSILRAIENLISQAHSQKSEMAVLQMTPKPSNNYIQNTDQFRLRIFANFIYISDILDSLPSPGIHTFFEALYHLASDDTDKGETSEEAGITYSTLWMTAVQKASTHRSKKFARELASVVIQKASEVRTNITSGLAIKTLPTVAIDLLDRNACISTADAILDTLLYTTVNDYRLLDLLKALQVFSKKFMGAIRIFKADLPLRSNELEYSQFALVALACRLDRGYEQRLRATQELELLKQITSTVLTFHSRTSQGNADFLPNLSKTLRHILLSTSARSYVIAAIIQICLNHLSSLGENLAQQHLEVQAMRQHQHHLVQAWYIELYMVGTRSPQSMLTTAGITLDCLLGYSDILVQPPKCCAFCGHEMSSQPLWETLRAQDMAAIGETTPLSEEVSDEWYKIRGHKMSLRALLSKSFNDGEDTADHVQKFKTAQSPYEQRLLLKQWHRMGGKDPAIIQSILPEIISCMQSQTFFEIEPLLLTHSMIPMFPGFKRSHDKDTLGSDAESENDIAADKENRESFTILLNGMCNTANQTSKTSMCILSLRCINTMLRIKAQFITQWHIDSIMACIAVTAGRLKQTYDPKAASHVHIALTRVFGSILAAHRLKLGGRYHMILLALQALLNPLFTPFKAPTSDRVSKTHAPPIDHSHTFTSTHTENLSRILSSISDPTVSAVSHRRSKIQQNSALNDETKKARTESGKHMLYFIMEFCMLQLSGRMEGEGMKEKLMPGIWSVLNAMSREVMGAMNAQMSVAGREIWREIYVEWKREGRGRERG